MELNDFEWVLYGDTITDNALRSTDLALEVLNDAVPILGDVNLADLSRIVVALRRSLEDERLRNQVLSEKMRLCVKSTVPYDDIGNEVDRANVIRSDVLAAWKKLKMSKCVLNGV